MMGLLGLFVLANCGNPFFNNALGEKKQPPRLYSIGIGEISRGRIVAKPETAAAGAVVALYISPDPGYRLTPDSLKYGDKHGSHPIDETLRTFQMPASDVTVTGEFMALGGGEFSASVIIGNMINGTVTARPEHGRQGDLVYLTVNPDPGYQLKGGSLRYAEAPANYDGSTFEPAGAVDIDEKTRTFALPDKNVIITAEFIPSQGGYSVSVGNLLNGALDARPLFGMPGDEISVVVSPKPGYKLKPGTLRYGSTPVDEVFRSFKLPAENITLTAEFEELSGGLYTAGTDRTAHGVILVQPEYGRPGEEITLIVQAEKGYKLKDKSLNYTGAGGTVEIDPDLRAFFMPAENIRIHAEFEDIPPGAFSVSVGRLSNGRIIPVPEYGSPQDRIRLRVLPKPDFRLKRNTLKYVAASGAEAAIDEQGLSFQMPACHVEIQALFDAQLYIVSPGQLQNGGVTARPEEAKPGAEISLAVSPQAGFKLKDKTLGLIDSQGKFIPADDLHRTFIMPADDLSTAAEFETLGSGLYSVSAGAFPNGVVSAQPEYGPPGTVITVTVSPDPGFALKPGSLKYGTAAVDEQTRSFTLPAAHVSVSAEFEALPADTYSVSAGRLARGSILASPEYGPRDTPVSLRVFPDPGYRLKENSLYYRDGAGPHPVDEGKRTFRLPASHVKVGAEFTALPANTYSVSAGRVPHGFITLKPEYAPAGTEIQVILNADPGYSLKGGSLKYQAGAAGGNIDEFSRRFTLSAANTLVTAEFETAGPGLYAVTLDPSPFGRVAASPEKGAPGDEVFLTVIPDPGYRLKKGSLKYGAQAVDERSRSFKLGAAHVRVSAEFEPLPSNTYTAAADRVLHGRIRATPEYGPANQEIELSVVPDPGYRLKKNSLEYRNGPVNTPVNEQTLKFRLPAAHVRISGIFEAIPVYQVLIDGALSNGVISAAPKAGPPGTEISLSIKANPLYVFKPGTLKYRGPAGEQAIDEGSKKFRMPEGDVTVTGRFVSTNALLRDLRVEGKTVPGFDPQKTDYTLRLPQGANSVTLNAETAHSAASLRDGNLSLNLDYFANSHTLEVSAEDGKTKKTYRLTLIRELLPLAAVRAGSFRRDVDPANVSGITRPFRMGKFEVTQQEYERVMGYARGSPRNDQNPVSEITWYEALLFANTLSGLEQKRPAYMVNGERDYKKWPATPGNGPNLWAHIEFDPAADGYRLPTEMEWLWAAMGADALDPGKPNVKGYGSPCAGYMSGGVVGDYAWIDQPFGAPMAVGRKKPNELGIYDMTGNVAEWCWDWYEGDDQKQFAFTVSGALTDYKGPASGSKRMAKGGHYGNGTHQVHLMFRGEEKITYAFEDPFRASNKIGIRLICGE
jgi:formylglycine-generating enzyme required for sulfatase activity